VGVRNNFSIYKKNPLFLCRFYKLAKAISTAARNSDCLRKDGSKLNIDDALKPFKVLRSKGFPGILNENLADAFVGFEEDIALLERLGVTTVTQLAKWQPARAAEAIVVLADFEADSLEANK
jgi:hypothetical protein